MRPPTISLYRHETVFFDGRLVGGQGSYWIGLTPAAMANGSAGAAAPCAFMFSQMVIASLVANARAPDVPGVTGTPVAQ